MESRVSDFIKFASFEKGTNACLQLIDACYRFITNSCKIIRAHRGPSYWTRTGWVAGRTNGLAAHGRSLYDPKKMKTDPISVEREPRRRGELMELTGPRAQGTLGASWGSRIQEQAVGIGDESQGHGIGELRESGSSSPPEVELRVSFFE
ncbi:hypothetical protein CRG98_037290 [Punica granatum]|uniref:Uncharacterized protein n=1 Tax=Punica granatum TaxID=22663 RepID=A0A2I0IE84_PUNGR|nr:hypothetical protein CRG98_037290 [Punica granatum]